MVGESEVIGTVVETAGEGESVAGRIETDGAVGTSKLEGTPDELPSSPWTATKARDSERSLIMHILVVY